MLAAESFVDPERHEGTCYISAHHGAKTVAACARITQEDILAGKLVEPGSQMRVLIHRANPWPENQGSAGSFLERYAETIGQKRDE